MDTATFLRELGTKLQRLKTERRKFVKDRAQAALAKKAAPAAAPVQLRLIDSSDEDWRFVRELTDSKGGA